MLARMKYMEEQMNEAQAALARKHTQQAEILARSEAAEIARDNGKLIGLTLTARDNGKLCNRVDDQALVSL